MGDISWDLNAILEDLLPNIRMILLPYVALSHCVKPDHSHQNDAHTTNLAIRRTARSFDVLNCFLCPLHDPVHVFGATDIIV